MSLIIWPTRLIYGVVAPKIQAMLLVINQARLLLVLQMWIACALYTAKTSAEINHSCSTPTRFVTYPSSRENSSYYKLNDYFIDLLHLALDKAGSCYHAKGIELQSINQARTTRNLSKYRYDIHWINLSESDNELITKINVPLTKGLIGTRLFLIRKGDQQRFSNLSLLELKNLNAGQGHDWPDLKILRNNGFHVIESYSWEGLFQMLHKKRIDYFPRSILEIWRDLDMFPELNFIVEQHHLIRYDRDFYFYVNNDQKELLAIVEKGLTNAIEDDSFDKLFKKYFSEPIEKAQINERIIHDISTAP
ncbi:transporter substrate-binding domain-containing protein [Teredinibacter franksiae]|uniref:transporter substrate-binding domain-containing protein n=1 Tax=Teredinibacter franksiae TaxID=2761453 RepID=UPI001629BB0E|nr:transporter substrate-binding domain-containing protein [Teredinibacter franksiae]